ncbi:MAG: hypothetical protein IJ418_09275 [Clostridia bacterium]|nr:hypothetical protein [Clostridia bacterium]
MWIITNDSVHDAGSNPALNIPRSKDYLERMSRKKSAERKHVFRLMSKGREMFRGVAYFENDASFCYILRPLDEFGRSEYDCDEIQYMVKELHSTPTGRVLWNSIPEEDGRRIDQLIAGGAIKNMRALLTEFDENSVCELLPVDIGGAIVKYE